MKLDTIKARFANLRVFYPRIRCPYCRSRRNRTVLKITPQALRECRDCSLIFLHPPLAREDLKRRYSQDFQCFNYEMAKVEQIPLQRLRETVFNRDRDIDFLMEFKKSGLVLDLGCSWGFLMYQAQERGFTVKGVEISSSHARHARERLGLDVVTGELEDASYPDNHFDGILAIHVLEHVADLRRTLKEIYRVLKEDGVVVIIVPNFDSISRKRLGSEWKWLEPNWHSFHFTGAFMKRALKDAGFECALRSEEGQYGMDFLQQFCSPEEINEIHERLEGSELIAIARKLKSNR